MKSEGEYNENTRSAKGSSLDPDQLQRLVGAAEIVFGRYINRVNQNEERIKKMIAIHNTSLETDVLRAAVVFLHATMEDFLRTVEEAYLPLAAEEVLNSIPLAGTENTRAEKFYLGKLAQHRGKTIDEVIHESVQKHLERSNYNNADEIIGFIKKLGIDRKTIEPFLADVEAMMKRRHQIVHRADVLEFSQQGELSIAPITSQDVERWLKVTFDFYESIVLHMMTTYFGKMSPEQLRAITNPS